MSIGNLTVICFLFLTGSGQAGTAVVELRYISTTKFVEHWVTATEASAATATQNKVQTSSEVRIDGLRLQIDERKSTVTLSGNEQSIRKFKDLANALDHPPLVIQLSLVRFEVDLDAGQNAVEILEVEGGVPVFPSGEKTVGLLLEKAKKSGHLNVVSNLDVLCINNEGATFTSTSRQFPDQTFETVVTPMVNSRQEVLLSVISKSGKAGAISTLSSKTTIPNGAAVLIGGLIQKNSPGNRVESAILVKSAILDSEGQPSEK